MMRQFLLAVVFATAGLGEVCGDTSDRTAVPSKADQERALALVRDVFKEFYGGELPGDKRRLAGRLFKAALTTKDDAASAYVLLREVQRVATEVEDVDRAVAAIEYLDSMYAIDGDEEKMTLLGKLAGRVETPEANSVVLAVAISAARRLVIKRDYRRAGNFVIVAQRSAGNNQKALKEIAQIRSTASAAIRLEKKMAPYRETLKSTPDDPLANYVIGRYESFYEGHWQSGLSKLAMGSNATLKELAAKSLAIGVDASATYSLAARWWDVAEKLKGREQSEVRQFAASLYQAALPGLTGLYKISAEKRISEYMAEAGHVPPPLPDGIQLETKPQPRIITVPSSPRKSQRGNRKTTNRNKPKR